MRFFALLGAFVMAMTTGAAADDSAAIKELAPTGKLRVAIAVGPAPSALWTVRDPATGKARGVPVELGSALAAKLKVPVEFVEFQASGEIVASRDANKWDVTFVPVDDDRKKVIDFGAPYHLLQSTYLVAPGSVIKNLDEVNRAGVRIAGVDGTATFRASTKASPNATAVTVKNPDEAIALMKAGKVDAIALSARDDRPARRHDARLARARWRLSQFDDGGRGAEKQAGGARLREGVHRGSEPVRPCSPRARHDGIENVANPAARDEAVAARVSLRSFPRRRESRPLAPAFHLLLRVPACAGTSGVQNYFFFRPGLPACFLLDLL